MGHLVDNLRYNLHGAGGTADNRHALVCQVDVMVPMRGMKAGALKFVFAFEVGRLRHMQPPHGRDHNIGCFGCTLGKIKMPNTIFVTCVRQGAVKRAMGQEPVLFRRCFAILLNLAARRKRLAPIRIALKRK